MNGKKFKEKTFILLIAIMTVFIAACSSNQNNKVESVTFDIPKEAMFLTENEWAHYDPMMDEAETLYFAEDGTFTYNCECGEPIGNSDMYDIWRYDTETQTIYMTTSYVDEQIPEVPIRILRNDGYRIVVEVNGDIKSFERYDDNYENPEINYDYSDKVNGYSAYLTFNKLEGNAMTVSPYYYDGDIDEHREMQHEEIIAKDATFHRIEIHTEVDEDGETTSTSNKEDLTMEDLIAEMEDCSGMGFVWYNEDLEIEKILFYGEIINYE